MTATLTDVEFASAGGATTLTLGPEAISALVEALAGHVAPTTQPSPYMTVVEAAAYLRAPRHRVDGLLSARKLTRHKDGSRTLVSRAEVEAHVVAQ